MTNDRDDLAALTDDDTRTWVGPPIGPDDIRTWEGLESIIDADESWSPGAATVAKMKAAGWTEPKPPKVYPPHDIDMERAPYCTVCGRDVQWNDASERLEHL